ncbi:carboxypeptidase-like regulatory domain-containing protein [Pelatocladus sp. BLCC-F211]|uniref:carboxypeptidase-like regulatory domain-containing protein n=1 Tax=Pelatocladus sp. BLCC-F211 TaxID=3342752 RepID=UPI0035B7CB65
MTHVISPPELPNDSYLISVNIGRKHFNLVTEETTKINPKSTLPEISEPQFSISHQKLVADLKTSSGNKNQAIAPVIQPQIIPSITPPESFVPETSVSKSTAATGSSIPSIAGNSQVFPVGLDVGQRNIIKSVLVRGKEDGMQAIDFEQWLIPYDTVIQALNLNVTPLPDGLQEVRAPGFVIRINPKLLRNDPKLGLVFSVQDLQTLFGVPAEFDINDYAVRLLPPWLKTPVPQVFSEPQEAPPEMAGLPEVIPPDFSITNVEQRLYVNGLTNYATSYQGNLTAVGTALGGSWFIRANQPNFKNAATWQISEAQFLRQTNRADYILGSQTPFWFGQQTGDYWGFTTIQRQGYKPKETLLGATPDPRQRLQAAEIGRVITGKAEPGTLVRLTQAFSDRPIAEVLVDSSGIYRFDNLQVNSRFLASNYRLLLYPQGRLTEAPEIRDLTFSSAPGQLPAGANALIFSGGLRRKFSTDSANLLGEFTDFRGGVAQRWGLSESLTIGIGGVYDNSFRGLGEIFYQPQNLPLTVAVSALSGDENNHWDVNADIRFDLSRTARTRFFSDRFGSNFNFDWRIFPWLGFLGGYDSRDGAFGGLEISHSGKNSFTFARATLDSQNHFRWSFLQRLGDMEFTTRGNEVGSLSQLAYNFSGKSPLDTGHSLLVNYETSNFFTQENSLASASWRYRSPARAIDGSYLWEAQLGYGIGSQGSGAIASLGTTIIPGIMLRGRYQGVSLTSDQPSFGIELVSSFDMQRGIKPDSSRRSNYFRTQGGILIQPFFDRNQNGKRDPNEAVYLNQLELMLILNNRPLKFFQPEIQNEAALVRLSPGKYRLDLDPAGFPLDWKATTDALAVDVVAGSYTTVELPLIKSYTRTGVVTDVKGQPVAGVRVEAVQANSGLRRLSVTNGAGVYYLEGLPQGNYALEVNGKPALPDNLQLEESSQSFQEINLQQN